MESNLNFSSVFFFFFKQKTAYEITTGDWSSDVCSSDLVAGSAFNHSLNKNGRSANAIAAYVWVNINLIPARSRGVNSEEGFLNALIIPKKPVNPSAIEAAARRKSW